MNHPQFHHRYKIGGIYGINHVRKRVLYDCFGPTYKETLPILDTLQKMTNSLLANVDIPIPKD